MPNIPDNSTDLPEKSTGWPVGSVDLVESQVIQHDPRVDITEHRGADDLQRPVGRAGCDRLVFGGIEEQRLVGLGIATETIAKGLVSDPGNFEQRRRYPSALFRFLVHGPHLSSVEIEQNIRFRPDDGQSATVVPSAGRL